MTRVDLEDFGSARQIEHKLVTPYYLWTNGQAEQMIRIVKEATIKSFHSIDLRSFEVNVFAFVSACNSAKHLKSLQWKTPFQAVCQPWI